MEYVPMPNTLGFIMQRVCFFNVFFLMLRPGDFDVWGPERLASLAVAIASLKKIDQWFIVIYWFGILRSPIFSGVAIGQRKGFTVHISLWRHWNAGYDLEGSNVS